MKRISDMSNEELIRLQLEQKEKIRRVKKIKAWTRLIILGILLVLIIFFVSQCSRLFNFSDLDNVSNPQAATNESIIQFFP